MKLKKGILLTALTLAAVSILGTSSNVQATTAIEAKMLNIKPIRSSGYGYKVVNKTNKFIWKIYNATNDTNETFYCIKGGPGFGDGTTTPTIQPAEYKEFFDMKKPEEITGAYRDALDLLFTGNNPNKNYESLMWVLDQCYIPAKNNASTEDIEIAAKSKESLLEAVEAYAKKYSQIYTNTNKDTARLVDNLNDDDIDSIQQLAIWYFTNDDDYHIDGNPTIQLGQNGSIYTALNSNDDVQNARKNAMNALFSYLTRTPKDASFSYEYRTTGETTSPVQLVQTNPTVEKDTNTNRYIIGPYAINELRKIAYNLDVEFISGTGTTITDVKFLDSNKAEMPTTTTIKDLVGTDNMFYISIPGLTDVTNVKMRITGDYSETMVKYWSVTNPSPLRDQPIVQVEKKNNPITMEIDAQKQPDREFDLALRKFIVSITSNGETNTLTGENSREPVIRPKEYNANSELTAEELEKLELENLANKQATGKDNTSAYKYHRKDALTVKTGDIVKYKIRIYNEGDIAGYATQVTDYLPEGLEFIPATESITNAAYGWSSEDGKTIKTNYLAKRKIAAFDGEELHYEDLEIECKVTAQAGANSKSLKNIAEITDHEDENANQRPNLIDRDSTPESLTPEQIKDYNENDEYSEDDDDFEHLILQPEEPKEFDLALRKYITTIKRNGKQIPYDREPKITPIEDRNNANMTAEEKQAKELQNLANKQATGTNKKGTETTTTYKDHPKDAITVQTGDRVIYTIRIYNEGEVNGWATQITDHLPEGLKFVPTTESDINDRFKWSQIDSKTIVTDYLAASDKKLNAFDGTTLDYQDVQIECEVIAVAGASTKNLKNIAEITENKDENDNTSRELDRDSRPNSLTEEQIRNYGTINEQDDDDFEDLKLLPATQKVFDLSLRKFITEVVDGGVGFSVTYKGQEGGYDVVGAIKIPKTNIEYPIYAVTTPKAIQRGIGFMYGVDPNQVGNSVYVGLDDQEGKFFFNNKNLEKGDEIYIKDVSGKVFAYKIYDKYEVDSENSDYASRETNGKREITLSTMADDGEKRLIIVATESGEITTGQKHNISSREPKVDVNPLLEGKDTADYNHTKQPVGVANNNIVTYTIRVYNEGQVDGYVTEITDHLPPQLEFLKDDSLNQQYGWQIVETEGTAENMIVRSVKTNITSPTDKDTKANRELIYGEGAESVLLNAFSYQKDDELDYIDVQIRCRVRENIDVTKKITNIAEITDCTDSEGNEVVDRNGTESKKDNAVVPTDETLPEYKDQEIDSGIPYIPGQEDDDDFEKLELKIFDLALRKFITGVSNGEKTTEITDREPKFVKNGTQYSYEHTKEPVEVANGNIVIYTLRIFNEGNVAGYASKVRDDLPQGLEFLPEHSVNTAYLWDMYKEDGTKTKVVSEAKYIQTEFLSQEKEKPGNENLIKAFDPNTMNEPDYKEVKIAFKVTEPNTSDRIIINQAQISDDRDENNKEVDDIDSKPNEWNEGEDDQDIEKVKVKYFDLSLKKWVTESIVTVDGKTKVTKSGHTGNENPEPPMKVEIPYGKTNSIVVKFRFNIKVTNEGEIAGYVKEIEDYIPNGLKFVAKDNPKWTKKDGKVTTDQLKDKLLQPGESATVNIVLTWINGKNNMGEKVNWAEISKDENEYNSPDIDSTPGNKVKGEDDIDQAPVLLSPATGKTPTYIALVLGCISIMASGIFLIKKFVM